MDKRRILVVDDDEAVRSVTHEMLDRLGFEVATAASGESALEQVSHRSFDLVLLDLAMPAMSGAEVYSSMRERDASTRVIFMTGYSRDELGDLVNGDTSTAVLSKPFPMQELKSSVEKILG